MKTIAIMLLCVCLTITTQAQKDFTDSIATALKHKPRAYVALNNRNSFIQNQKTPINGVKVGLNFKSQFVIGMCYNWIPKGFVVDNNTIKANYVSAFAEYTFYTAKRWQIAIPVQVGLGSICNNKNNASTLAFFYEPTMSCTWKPTRYIGVGLDIGYRIVLKNNTIIPQHFTSPTYSFGLVFFFGTMYKDAKAFYTQRASKQDTVYIK
jgi:hypothetical protein